MISARVKFGTHCHILNITNQQNCCGMTVTDLYSHKSYIWSTGDAGVGVVAASDVAVLHEGQLTWTTSSGLSR